MLRAHKLYNVAMNRNPDIPQRCWQFSHYMVTGLLVGLLSSSPVVSSQLHDAISVSVDAEPITKNIAAGGIHEECALVRSYHRLAYQFQTTAETEFNLHYHSADKADVTYLFGPAPVQNQPHNNFYVAPTSKVICFMWENKSAQTIRLDYSFSVTPAEG